MDGGGGEVLAVLEFYLDSVAMSSGLLSIFVDGNLLYSLIRSWADISSSTLSKDIIYYKLLYPLYLNSSKVKIIVVNVIATLQTAIPSQPAIKPDISSQTLR